MSWSNIVKHAMKKPGKLAKVTGKKVKRYAYDHPIKSTAGVLGATALIGGSGDDMEDQAVDLYTQGKSIEEIQQLLPDLPPEVLDSLIKTEEYNNSVAANDDIDLTAHKFIYDLYGDKSLQRILKARQGE